MEESESPEMHQQLTEVIMEAVTNSEHENGINELLALSSMKNFQSCLKSVLEELIPKYVRVVSFSWDKQKRRSFCSFLGRLLIKSGQPEYGFCAIENFVLDTLSSWIHQDLLQITTEKYEVYVDCLCVLLPLIGENLEMICPERLDVMFSSIQDVVLDSRMPRFIKSNMLNLLLLRESLWTHPRSKGSKLINCNRGKLHAADEFIKAEKDDDCADNSYVQNGNSLTVDDCVPESGDNSKPASKKAIYDFVEKILSHLGQISYFPAFVKHGVCDHVILSSSCEDLPSKLKPLRLSDQAIKEITVFMSGFHSAYSSDADNEAFSKLPIVLTDKSGNSQLTEQENCIVGSCCNFVEHCEPTGPQSSECLTGPRTRTPVSLKQQLSDPCAMSCNDTKNCKLHGSCILTKSHSTPKICNNTWYFHSKLPDSFVPINSALGNKDQHHHVVRKDVDPPVSLKYREKNSISEIDVSFVQKVGKQIEHHKKWNEFFSKCNSAQKFKSSF